MYDDKEPLRVLLLAPDPAAVEGTDAEKSLAFADTYRMMSNRISIFINLPMQSLDRMALQKRLENIGAEADAKGAA